MTKSVASKIFSNLQASLHSNIFGIFFPSNKGLGVISFPVLCCSPHNCQETNPSANTKSAFSQISGLQGIKRFQVALQSIFRNQGFYALRKSLKLLSEKLSMLFCSTALMLAVEPSFLISSPIGRPSKTLARSFAVQIRRNFICKNF